MHEGGCCVVMGMADALGRLDLRHVPNLQSLTFTVDSAPTSLDTVNNPGVMVPWNDWITAALVRARRLARLSSLCIQTHVWPDAEEYLYGFDWKILDNLLAADEHGWTALRTVEWVIITEAESYEDVVFSEWVVRERLSLLEGQGLLKFTYMPPQWQLGA
jgi:hypothetical protein